MSELARRRCEPCREAQPPLAEKQIEPLRREVPDWEVVSGNRLLRQLAFRDFATALRFVDRVGAVADAEGHHPDIHLGYGRVVIEIWTHKIGGLSEADFVLAAKVDELVRDAEGLRRQ